MKLVLASQSPRRRELLSMIAPEFSVRVSDADETLAPGTPPREGVVLLAEKKARTVLEDLLAQPGPREEFCVVGSDTVVVLGDRVLGKPHSHQECVAMLELLSGKEHTVCTGVAVLTSTGGREVFCQSTQVEFYPLSPEEIAWYASTPEPYDKAGAYGIQGLGSVLVKGISGDYFSVMGLPVARLARVLAQLGAGPSPLVFLPGNPEPGADV